LELKLVNKPTTPDPLTTEKLNFGQLQKFSSTAEGFELLDQWMKDICNHQGEAKVIAGFEHTGL